MAEPWTTSASVSIGADGIVTLVEGSAFCISARSGEIDPARVRRGSSSATRGSCPSCAARSTARPPEPLAATSPDPFSGVFVLRGHPAHGQADSHLVLYRRRYVGRGMREDFEIENFGEEAAFCSLELMIDADFADLFEVKEGRVNPAGQPGGASRTGLDSPSRGSTAPCAAPRTSTSARVPHRARQARAVRGGGAAARPLVDVHAGDAGDRRAGDHAALPLRAAGRTIDARRAARGVEAAHARRDERRRSVPRAARTLDAGPRRAADLRPRVSPTARSSRPARRGS